MRWEKEVSEGKEVARCTMIRFHVSFRENYKYLHRSFILLSGAIFRTAVTSIFISNKLHLVGRNAVSTSSPRFVAGSESAPFMSKSLFWLLYFLFLSRLFVASSSTHVHFPFCQQYSFMMINQEAIIITVQLWQLNRNFSRMEWNEFMQLEVKFINMEKAFTCKSYPLPFKARWKLQISNRFTKRKRSSKCQG